MESNFDKIIILGSSCSGKTTLGRKLSILNQAKHIDLDDFNWLPDWKSRPTDELISKVDKAIWGESRWVISGNYRNTHSMTMPQATCVIWLDFRLRLVLWRMLKRTIKRIVTKEETCNGNYETISGAFFDKGNLFSYTVNTYQERKKQFSILGQQYPHLKIYRIKSPLRLRRFIASFEKIL